AQSRGSVLEFDTTGNAPPSETPLDEFESTSGSRLPCALSVGTGEEAVYLGDVFNGGDVAKGGLAKYIGGEIGSTGGGDPVRGLTVDQTDVAGHLFAIVGEGFVGRTGSSLTEYEPCSSPHCGAALLGSSDPGLIGDGRGVAYNPAQDWVYVADHLTQ